MVVALLVAAAAGSTVTYLAVGDQRAASTPAASQTASPSSASATPQFSAAEVDAAKQHLCQVFDVSVRGEEGQGGLRVQGNLNVPIALRTLNSATACRTRSFRPYPPMLHRQQASTSVQRWRRQQPSWATPRQVKSIG
jgi:hypothetical protein